MSRVSAKYHTPPAARRGRSAVATEMPVDAAGHALDYLARNRAAWELWAHEYAAAGRAAWRDDELRWGIWALPEEELQLFGDLGSDADVVELGAGPAAASAWLARNGMRPIAVDFARGQIETAQRLQLEF